jgi:hypothetical protein
MPGVAPPGVVVPPLLLTLVPPDVSAPVPVAAASVPGLPLVPPDVSALVPDVLAPELSPFTAPPVS